MIETLKKFSKNKHVFCYGIGKWGKLIATYCLKHNINIDGFIVSSTRNSKKELLKKKVSVIDDCLFPPNTAIIIAALSKDNQKEMIMKIKELSICEDVYIPFEHEDFISYFKRYRNKKIRKESNKRRNYNIFNYMRLKVPIPFLSVYGSSEASHYDSIHYTYGHGNIVRKYIKNLRYDLSKSTIIHAAFWGPYCTNTEINPSDNNIFCMSEEVFRNYGSIHGNNIYGLGPYILHVKPIISYKKINDIKKRFGKTLMVVPIHIGEVGEFSYYDLIAEIERVKEKGCFKTVMVCIGPNGFNNPEYKLLLKMNYKVVTAGDMFDNNFLRRLRAFIAISDVTMGNSYGTFIGYSIALNKPFYYYPMKINNDNGAALRERVGYAMRDLNFEEEEVSKLFLDNFGNYREEITERQIKIVERFWGTWNRKKQCI